MRALSRARWASCALAASLVMSIVPSFVSSLAPSLAPSLAAWFVTPAFADRGKSLARCTTFDQVDKGEAGVAFTIRSTCTIPIDCDVSWRVVCAPESKKRRAAHPSSAKLALAAGGGETTEASAAVCGDDAWTIDDVHWRCAPNND